MPSSVVDDAAEDDDDLPPPPRPPPGSSVRTPASSQQHPLTPLNDGPTGGSSHREHARRSAKQLWEPKTRPTSKCVLLTRWNHVASLMFTQAARTSLCLCHVSPRAYVSTHLAVRRLWVRVERMRATQVQEQEYARWLRERDIAQRRRELDGTMLQLGVPPLRPFTGLKLPHDATPAWDGLGHVKDEGHSVTLRDRYGSHYSSTPRETSFVRTGHVSTQLAPMAGSPAPSAEQTPRAGISGDAPPLPAWWTSSAVSPRGQRYVRFLSPRPMPAMVSDRLGEPRLHPAHELRAVLPPTPHLRHRVPGPLLRERDVTQERLHGAVTERLSTVREMRDWAVVEAARQAARILS